MRGRALSRRRVRLVRIAEVTMVIGSARQHRSASLASNEASAQTAE